MRKLKLLREPQVVSNMREINTLHSARVEISATKLMQALEKVEWFLLASHLSCWTHKRGSVSTIRG